MTKIIAIFNKFFSSITDLIILESGEISQLGEKANKGEFKADPLSEGELVKLANEVKARLQRQSSNGSNLILGSADFLPFDFFRKGRDAGAAVCCLLKRFNDDELDRIVELAKEEAREKRKYARIRAAAIKWFVDPGSLMDPANEADREEFRRQAKLKQVPCGTGFLVGDRYLLTNLHVVENKEKLSDFSAAFGYEGALDRAEIYDVDPDFWKPAQNLDLDYVLLKLKPRDSQDVGAKFTPLSLRTVNAVQVVPERICKSLDPQYVESLYQAGKLSEEERNQVLTLLNDDRWRGDLVNIIQHPEGRSKEIVIFNNQLQELYRDFLVYTSDTQPGSSGSPLFNAQWELIGLHQAALLEPNESDVYGEGSFKVKGYLGIRMSSILADLRQQAEEDDDIKEFFKSIDRVVPTPSPMPSPPPPSRQRGRQVFILAGRDRAKVLPKEFAAIEQKAMLKLQAQVKQALNQLDPSIKVQLIEGSGTDLESAIDRINFKAGESGDTQSAAIELLTDEYCDPKVGGISAYYYSGNPRRKDDTNAFLNPIREKGIPLFGIGAYSEAVTRAGRLEFCRRTTMPALVFYAGYLSNPKDRARIEALGTEISPLAEGMAAGLLAWLQRIH